MTNYKNLVKLAIKAFIETCGGPLTNIVVNVLYNGQLTFAQSLREVKCLMDYFSHFNGNLNLLCQRREEKDYV